MSSTSRSGGAAASKPASRTSSAVNGAAKKRPRSAKTRTTRNARHGGGGEAGLAGGLGLCERHATTHDGLTTRSMAMLHDVDAAALIGCLGKATLQLSRRHP
jgi:hypothetical protein